MRASAFLIAAVLAGALDQAQPQPKLPALLDGDTVVELRVEAPLQQLFANPSEQDAAVPGKVVYKDPKTGADVTLDDVEVSVRGHTSRRETECSFPKLKLKLKGAGSLKIGTHCGEAQGAQLTTKYGRLANEQSPAREALAYRMLREAGVPTLRSRPARVTYVDADRAGQPLTRNALLLEDDDDAMKRVGGTAELTLDNFGNVTSRRATEDAGLIAFGEAMIGNFDWCLKFSPDDIYRCNDPKPLWNVLAFERNGGVALMMKDFDLAGVVVGTHTWFDSVWNRGFVPSKSPIEIEVLSQVQRTRSLFSRDRLDGLRRHFLDRKSAVLGAIQSAPVDEQGRTLARSYADQFFAAIADDKGFYRPVVTRSDVQVYMDAERTKEACGPKDVMRSGTPVNEIQRSGQMAQVVILDVMWRWASERECNNVQDGPVWIASDAISTDFPPQKNR